MSRRPVHPAVNCRAIFTWSLRDRPCSVLATVTGSDMSSRRDGRPPARGGRHPWTIEPASSSGVPKGRTKIARRFIAALHDVNHPPCRPPILLESRRDGRTSTPRVPVVAFEATSFRKADLFLLGASASLFGRPYGTSRQHKEVNGCRVAPSTRQQTAGLFSQGPSGTRPETIQTDRPQRILAGPGVRESARADSAHAGARGETSVGDVAGDRHNVRCQAGVR
jgi:hypothetical protein